MYSRERCIGGYFVLTEISHVCLLGWEQVGINDRNCRGRGRNVAPATPFSTGVIFSPHCAWLFSGFHRQVITLNQTKRYEDYEWNKKLFKEPKLVCYNHKRYLSFKHLVLLIFF